MRKREIDDLENRLNSLKYEIIKNIRTTSDNIDILNTLSSSEEAELGSVMSLAKIDENTLEKGNKDLLEINRALKKISLNEYGKCEMCHKQIDVKRLRVKPHARYCISCREIYEEQNK